MGEASSASAKAAPSIGGQAAHDMGLLRRMDHPEASCLSLHCAWARKRGVLSLQTPILAFELVSLGTVALGLPPSGEQADARAHVEVDDRHDHFPHRNS